MPKVTETVLEVNLNALKNNYTYLKSKISNNTLFMAVVKAYAYGSDANEVANYLQELNVDYFAVAYTSEGVALRDAGITKPILVLHPVATAFETIIERCLEPSLYNTKVLNQFIAVAQAKNQNNYPIHLKFNTGLNRLGFTKTDISTISQTLTSQIAVKTKSIFSHMAASEDFDEKEFTLQQIATFNTIAKSFSTAIGYQPLLHMCNTSGILNYPEAHYNMVRSGIGLYGFGNSEKEDKNFTPIASLKSIISQIHYIKAGESIGYNRGFITTTDIKTATIPIGHADGISRQYGNGNGFVTINNKTAPIIGNVCMDMIMVNITDISCNEGDEVIIFGKTPTANQFAHGANTISYEILTAISQRVKRIISKE
ncbi:alanine racemase [Lacinutrix undariae]